MLIDGVRKSGVFGNNIERRRASIREADVSNNVTKIAPDRLMGEVGNVSFFFDVIADCWSVANG